MSRWQDKYLDSKFGKKWGRLGDTVSFASLPAESQSFAVGNILGAVGTHAQDGFEACA